MRWLFGIMAVMSAGYAAVLLWVMGAIAWHSIGQGSGGIGAVSAGFLEITVPFGAGVVANLLVARRARRLGGVVRTLHRAHSVLPFLLLGTSLLVIIGLRLPLAGTVWIPLVVLTVLLYAAQFAVLAAIFAALAMRSGTVPPAERA